MHDFKVEDPACGGGVFITFEGIEGAGKSTQVQRLAALLTKHNIPVCQTREPGGTPIGNEIRRILLDKQFAEMSLLAELFLFQAARVEHVERIISPALKSGEFVICDRFSDATLAYQGFGRGLPHNEVLYLNKLACKGIVPARTILLDIDPALGIVRVDSRKNKGNGEVNRLDEETIHFYERVRKGYLTLAAREPDRFKTIDASRGEEETAQDVWAACCDLIPLTNRNLS